MTVSPGSYNHCFAMHLSTLLWVLTSYALLKDGLASDDINNNDLCDNKPFTPEICMRPDSWCHHGECIRGNNSLALSVNCLCFRGWMKPDCLQCCDRPCGEHGVCDYSFVGTHHILVCRCDRTHKGDSCEVERCLKDCNNGTCIFENGKQQCKCSSGFFGENCDSK